MHILSSTQSKSLSMAKPRKRLGEFLKEQQEPFTLELYLLERGYTTKPKRDPLFQFSKVLTTLHKKLVFHNHSCIVIRDSDIIDKHVNVSVPNETESSDQTTVETEISVLNEAESTDQTIEDTDISVLNEAESIDQTIEETDFSVPNEAESSDQTIEDTERFSFSTATNSTVYLSCSDIDEDGYLLSPEKEKFLFSPNTCHSSNIRVEQSQQATNNEKHHDRCIEGSPVPESRNFSVTHGTLNQDVSGREERMSNCCVFVPKKLTEDSLLSVALWSSLIHSAKREKCSNKELELLGANPNVCHVFKSKTLLHKAKRLLFYCVREITINISRKDYRQQGQCFKQLIRGPEALGKRIWDKTRELGGELGGNETNLTNLLSLDYFDSMDDWSEFKPQVRHICLEVVDAVLERVTNEIVTEMIQVL